jgi:histidyl-tRNA synthetase
MPIKKKSSVPVLPEGMFDIIPSAQKYWHFLWRRANGLLSDYSFSRVDLAPVELADVFTRSVAQSNPDAAKHPSV